MRTLTLLSLLLVGHFAYSTTFTTIANGLNTAQNSLNSSGTGLISSVFSILKVYTSYYS